MAKTCPPARKRFAIAVSLGLLAWFLCTYLASSAVPSIWGTALMWTILADRILLGMVIGLAGAYLIHPIFRFPIPAWFRGTCLGVFVSLPLAAGAMVAPAAGTDAWTTFWLTLAAGAVFGLIIDLVATKYGGEGAELLK